MLRVKFIAVSVVTLVFLTASWGLKYSFKNATVRGILPNENFSLSCSADGGVKWTIPKFSSAIIEKISSFQEKVTCNKAVLYDQGDYFCMAKNNESEFAWASIYITGLKTSFNNHADLQLFPGETLIMNCSSHEEIKWIVPPTTRALIKWISDYEATIVINRANKSDNGIYMCRSKKNVDEFAEIRIRVMDLRTSFENGTNVIIPLNQKFKLNCSAEAGVEWTIPRKSSATIDKISVFEESVIFDRAVKSDSGEYECRSKTNSSEFAWLHVYVSGK